MLKIDNFFKKIKTLNVFLFEYPNILDLAQPKNGPWLFAQLRWMKGRIRSNPCVDAFKRSCGQFKHSRIAKKTRGYRVDALAFYSPHIAHLKVSRYDH